MRRDVRQVLAELELLSHGATQSWNPSTTGTRDRDPRPPGEAWPPHLTFRRAFEKCDGDPILTGRVLEEARAELDRFRGYGQAARLHKLPAETIEQRDKRILTEGLDWPPRDVASRFGVTARYIIRLRTNGGRDPASGRKWQTQEDPKIEAARLRAANVPVAVIATRLGVTSRTIHYWTRKAA